MGISILFRFSKDGKSFLIQSKQRGWGVYTHHFSLGRVEGNFELTNDHRGPSPVCFSNDDQFIVEGMQDGYIHIYDRASGELIISYLCSKYPISNVACNPTMAQFACTSRNSLVF